MTTILEGPQPLPVSKRERCRACDRHLKPNYSTEHKRSEKMVRSYKRKDGSAFNAGDYDVQHDDKGRWYREQPERLIVRSWRGTYGLRGLFCGINCACDWALGVCPALEAKGDHWIAGKAVTARNLRLKSEAEKIEPSTFEENDRKREAREFRLERLGYEKR